MKKLIYIALQLSLFNYCLVGQIGMHPNVILLGSDTIPYGDQVADTFQIFDLLKGGASFGTQYFNAWHRDSIGVGSFAAGAGSIASADYGIALGVRCKVQGHSGGVAIGAGSISKQAAFAFGNSC